MAKHKMKGWGWGGQRKTFLHARKPHFGQTRQTFKCGNWSLKMQKYRATV